MRIAFFAKRKRRTRTTRYIAAALERAGHRVLWLHERRRRRWLGTAAARAWTLRSVARFGPELVLVHADDISPETLEALAGQTRTALFTPDCWREPLAGAALERARRVDLLLTVAPGQIEAFRAAGVARAAWLAEACDPSEHHPVPPAGQAWSSQVAFIGKANRDAEAYAPRRELVQAVCARFDTAVYGAGWQPLGIEARLPELLPDGYRKVCAGAQIVLGRDWTDRCRGYFSNRTWFTLGCRGFLLTNYVPGLEEIFENHGQLVWYRSPHECLELIEHYLARPEERRRIAEAGHAYAIGRRTYDHFARDLVDLVEGRPAGFP